MKQSNGCRGIRQFSPPMLESEDVVEVLRAFDIAKGSLVTNSLGTTVEGSLLAKEIAMASSASLSVFRSKCTWILKLEVLCSWYCSSFQNLLPVMQEPIGFPSCRLGSAMAHALKEEVDKMLWKRAMEVVMNSGLEFYSRLFLVQKVAGEW